MLNGKINSRVAMASALGQSQSKTYQKQQSLVIVAGVACRTTALTLKRVS
jgi:hypothetical protein